MLKLNMKDFICSLDGLPESDKDEQWFGESYLTECVAMPFLCGEYISLHEIDWDAFGPEDARAMYYRCEETDRLGTPVLMLYAPAVSARPAADRFVRFV